MKPPSPWYQNQTKNITNKENYRTISLMKSKNHQQNIGKLHPKIHKKDHILWSSGIYSRVTRIAQVMRMWTRADTNAGQGHEGPGLSPKGRRLGRAWSTCPLALASAGVRCRPPVSFLWVKRGHFFIETLLPFSSSSPWNTSAPSPSPVCRKTGQRWPLF